MLLTVLSVINLALFAARVVLGALEQDEIFFHTLPSAAGYQLHLAFLHSSLLAAALGLPSTLLALRGVTDRNYYTLFAMSMVVATLCFWSMGCELGILFVVCCLLTGWI
eukprot:m.33346 g.33346  ORF g.33346 m.33346 type:complete len:109 (+) comp9461_c1_seq2:225-551(+)